MKKLLIPACAVLALVACGKNQEPAHSGQPQEPGLSPEQVAAEKTLQMGRTWLVENAKKQGVKTTLSGLQYKVLESGPADGKHPGPQQIVCVNYAGHLIGADKNFDSSYERGIPAAFPSNGLIKGWVEALHMMKPGDKWELYVPSELAYGVRGTPGGPIGPNEPLVFDVQLIKNMNISMDAYMKTYRQNPLLDCSADE